MHDIPAAYNFSIESCAAKVKGLVFPVLLHWPNLEICMASVLQDLRFKHLDTVPPIIHPFSISFFGGTVHTIHSCPLSHV